MDSLGRDEKCEQNFWPTQNVAILRLALSHLMSELQLPSRLDQKMMASQEVSLDQLLNSNSIKIELLPQKKGLVFKHVEYNVVSAKYKSQVVRRYSDFLALNEFLTGRYPYRLVPKLPPQKLAALYVGTDSDFAGSRKRALTRWLTLLNCHKIFSKDPMVEHFLTFMGNDFVTIFKEQFKSFPDEFITDEEAFKARDEINAEIRQEVDAGRSQVSVLTSVVLKLVDLLENLVERSTASGTDLEEFGRELASLSNEGYLTPKQSPSGGWLSLQKALHATTNHFNNLSSQWSENALRLDRDVLESLKMLQDLLLGYKDLCGRLDKKCLMNDQKKSWDKIQTFQKGKATGVLVNDPKHKEFLDKHLEDHMVNLIDLEARVAFSTICMTQETATVFIFTEVLGDVANSLASVQYENGKKINEIWKQILQCVQGFGMARNKGDKKTASTLEP